MLIYENESAKQETHAPLWRYVVAVNSSGFQKRRE